LRFSIVQQAFAVARSARSVPQGMV